MEQGGQGQHIAGECTALGSGDAQLLYAAHPLCYRPDSLSSWAGSGLWAVGHHLLI